MKFSGQTALLFVLFGAASVVQAGALYTSVGGPGVFLDIVPGVAFDINGSGVFVTAGLPANPVLLLDVSPPLVHPGNLTLIGADPAVTQLELASFDLAHPTIVGSHLFLPGTVNAITGVTDPGLAGLLGPVTFDFTLVGVTTISSTVDVTVFELSSIATGVPEPSTIALMGLGLALAAGASRRLSLPKRT